MADSKDTKVNTPSTPDSDEALESFLSRDQGAEPAEKQTEPDNGKKKINKRVLIIVIAAVAVAALVALLVFTREISKSEYNEDEATVHPAEITLGVNPDGEHTASVAVDEDGPPDAGDAVLSCHLKDFIRRVEPGDDSLVGEQKDDHDDHGQAFQQGK